MGGTMTTLRQEVVNDLLKKTNFNHSEICDLYRQYRLDTQQNELIVDRDYFKDMYQKEFPTGDIEPFSDLVFGTFDKDTEGRVDFQHFIVSLSAPLKGTQQEKNDWLFNFCDTNRDGRISKAEMLSVIQSVLSLNAGFFYATRHVTETQLVDYIFQVCTEDPTGHIYKSDFMTLATNSTTFKYILEGTMSAILAPYVTRKARTGSFGKARSSSIISVRRPSRSSSDEQEVELGDI